MKFIYDFDGTLTPYSLPQYEILKKCGYDDTKFMSAINQYTLEHKCELYIAYFEVYKNILHEHNISFNDASICLGAKNVIYNKGILEYLSYFKKNYKQLEQYVVTSGFEVYVKHTSIAEFFDDIFGTTFDYENNIATKVNTLVSDTYKVEIIKQICNNCHCEGKDIVYLGDGLTDTFAFEYVKSIGGTTIFICPHGKSNPKYTEINKNSIIDQCFNNDFSMDSDIFSYINQKLQSQKTK